MQKTTQFNTGMTAAAFLLIGTLAIAQTAPTARTVTPRDASSGQASGKMQRKDGAIHSADFPRSANSRNSANDASGKSGENPLYEGKGQANLKPGTGTSIVEYKDPEDMTTRYRPGNNKTTRTAGDAAASGAGAAQQGKTVENPVGEMKNSDNSRSSAHATEALQRKHLAGVKYEDRVAAEPAGQVSSKGIQEKGLTAAEPGQVNKMAIKENGISSSKPKPKP